MFLGGRIISTSHIAFSAVRVMRTLGMLGEVVGIAASLCKTHDCLPRSIYLDYLDELKESMKVGVSIPSAFACGGIGSEEAYHFKDIGWWRFHDSRCFDDNWKLKEPTSKEKEKFNYCVGKLGIKHKYKIPENFK